MSETIKKKIEELEFEYARTQKNKATSGHLGLIKAKIAKLKRELLEPGSGSGGGGKSSGFDVSKSGDTRVGLVGFPSVGKSTLLTKLTGTFSEAAAYEFTTLTAIPGTLHYRGARIQIVDLPGIIEGAKDGKGRGRQIISTARTCNMILIVLDAMKPVTHKKLIEKELDGFGIRLNQQPPEITYRRKDKGGINCQFAVQQSVLDVEMVTMILREYKVHCADVIFRCDATVDQLIDVVEGNRKYMPCIYVCNKIDQLCIEELDIIDQLPHHVPISAHHGWNIDELLERVWDYCNMIRIYTKPKGQIPDYNDPVILHMQNPSVEQFCNRIHKGIMAQFKYANVWGSSVKHQPQKCGKEHLLNDEDVVQIVKKV
mmetsp:Transcript_6790/g.9138  ORF Transcript_6790/g.9138 Transcript_6790/m.9138 type:complete len:371 (-) Transcript_6790:356-1468(-)|eukprot:CAMPEP_0117757292 /NCGR_PEP_ID=MMETSP0947-20121206/14638_1 /TAXON_ID=44440 /ORGANISM="Chattonella subsalsa, Strain CCMP2191" /LENGTH=370 /DNA_ID=CAMNT_0005577145 /DNA_START=20 /DNA_END=1132 /DNA_ORIENTATION=+